MIKYEIAQRPSRIATATFGPGGYTVYKVLKDSAGDVYHVPVADFKYKTDALVFKRAKTKGEKNGEKD